MPIDSFVGGLSHDDKLRVMELIWEDLIRHTPGYASPSWHADVLAERLANPSSSPRLSVDEAKVEIMERLKKTGLGPILSGTEFASRKK